MRNLSSIFAVSFGAFVAASFFAQDAHALGPIGVEAGGVVGYGTNPIHPNSVGSPLGVGAGGRAGITFFSLYAGARAIYYFGKDPSGDDFQTRHSLLYGGELGSNFGFGPLAIRPLIGLGVADLTGNPATGNAFDRSSTTHHKYIYAEPGITAIISLGGYFIGADANILIIPSVTDNDPAIAKSTYLAVTLHGQAGFSF